MNGPGKLFLWQIGVQGRLNRLSSILGNGIQSSLWRCVMHGVVPHLEKFECIKPYKKHWDNSVSYFQKELQCAQLAPPFPPFPLNTTREELPFCLVRAELPSQLRLWGRWGARERCSGRRWTGTLTQPLLFHGSQDGFLFHRPAACIHQTKDSFNLNGKMSGVGAWGEQPPES